MCPRREREQMRGEWMKVGTYGTTGGTVSTSEKQLTDALKMSIH